MACKKCDGGCNTGCHSGCVNSGPSSGCTCNNGCGNACQTCTTNCSGGCTGGCSGCLGNCTKECNNSCTGKCGGCDGTCTGGCKGCSGTCSGSCSGTCDGGCKGGCSGCDGGCTSCSNACSDANMMNAIKNLGGNIIAKGYIKAEDYLELKNGITNELRRRSKLSLDRNFNNPPTKDWHTIPEHIMKTYEAVYNFNPAYDFRSKAYSGAIIYTDDMDDIILYIRSLMSQRV